MCRVLAVVRTERHVMRREDGMRVEGRTHPRPLSHRRGERRGRRYLPTARVFAQRPSLVGEGVGVRSTPGSESGGEVYPCFVVLVLHVEIVAP
jgi:hypothetical protein